MKNVIVILCLLAAVPVTAQKYNDYNTIPELKRPQSLNVLQIGGIFKLEVGFFNRLTLKLDSSGSFKEDNIDCTDQYSTSGKWDLIGQKIILRDSSESRMYDVLQFRHLYILVLSQQKNDFIKQFKKVVKEAKKNKDINEDDFPLYVIDKLEVLIYSKKMESALRF